MIVISTNIKGNGTMAENLKRIVKSNINRLVIGDLNISFDKIGDVKDLLSLRTMEQITNSKELDMAIKNNWITIYDGNGNELTEDEATKATNRSTLYELDYEISNAPGSSGYSGTNGTSGYSGILGISGYSGIIGISGYSGIIGNLGASGYSGILGISGYSGIIGSLGTSGYSGIIGTSGYSGIIGVSGYSGIIGASGYSGFINSQITEFHQVGTSPLERWYLAGIKNNNILTTGLPVQDIITALPFTCSKNGTLDRIAINVTILGLLSKARIGIYQATSDTNLYPNNLLIGSGELDISSTGVKSVTIDVNVSAGTLYWFVIVTSNGLATITCLDILNTHPIFGMNSTFSTALGVGLYVSNSYGALPSTFPAGGSVLTLVPLPAIAARFSA